ncbi:MAG: carbohydrate ABC transporter permease [Gemmiger formicilis]|uniref:carbohydrate ABC transporter permease n=1 Tax=Gemmiger formicilis TaxID=745368 RepID=UPI0039940D36
MNTKTKRKVGSIVYNVVVCFFGLIMLYPLVWMVMSSFKETSTIFTTVGSLIPEKATLENYVNGWKGFGKVSFGTFFSNSMFISVIATVGTVISSSLVAYGFARCKFQGRGLLFAAMLVSMMLPAQVLMIPRYLWYPKSWAGSAPIQPLIVPYFFFAIQGTFVYLILNFIGGIPKDLDEAARIDGCSYFGIYLRIILPLIVPALITAGIFSFMWRWDDFLSAPCCMSRNPSAIPRPWH